MILTNSGIWTSFIWSHRFDMYICLCTCVCNNDKHANRQSQVRKPISSGVEWAEWSLMIGTGFEFKFSAWSSIAQSVCQRAFSLLAIWCLRLWVRILHSAEEDNLSPIDSKIACLCQSRASKLTTTNVYKLRNTNALFVSSVIWYQMDVMVFCV